MTSFLRAFLRRRAGLRLAAAWGAAIALSACGPSSQAPGAGGASASGADGATLRVTVPAYSDATKPYMEQMAQAFEQAHPGTRIKIEMVSWDNLQQKLQTDIAGHSAPDVAVIATRWLVDFVRDGQAEPLDAMPAGMKANFVPAFLQPGQVGGKSYGLPFAASARALFYNQDLLTRAGFANGPATWDDVQAAARKIKAAGAYGFGIQGKEIETDVYFDYALWSHGGDVIGPDGKAAFNSEAGVKAATLYKSMIDAGLTQPGVTGYSREDVQNLFKQGRLGMVITAPFLIKQLAKDAPKLAYGITGVPKGTTEVTFAVSDSIMVFKSSAHKALAMQFLEHLFAKPSRLQFDQNEGLLPVTQDVAADAAFAGDERLSQFVRLLPKARFAPTISGWDDVAKAQINALQAIYQGQAPPKAALDAAAAQANQALAR